MSFRPPRSLPILTLFHNVRSKQSKAALVMLQNKQKNMDGEEKYRIDVMDRATETQLKQIASFLNSSTPWKDMLLPEGIEKVNNANDAFQLVKSQPRLLQCPIVVDWENGKAAKDLDSIEQLINKRK